MTSRPMKALAKNAYCFVYHENSSIIRNDYLEILVGVRDPVKVCKYNL